jgi:hypothetical protein
MSLDPETRLALAHAVTYISDDRYLARYYKVPLTDVIRVRRNSQPKRQGRPTKLLDEPVPAMTTAEADAARMGSARLNEATRAMFVRQGRPLGLTGPQYGALALAALVTPEWIREAKERGL